MTQEFVTLPHSVVEQELAALIDKCIATYAIHGTNDYMIVDDGKARNELLTTIRAALEQPQNHVPDVGNMLSAGWKLVPVEPTVEMMDAGGAATRRCYQHLNKGEVMCSYVYRHMLDAAPQPPGEQPDHSEQSYMEGVTAGRHKLASEYPLPTDLYDSKDWRCGTYAERVEWLHTMYEDAKEQIAALEQPTSEDCSGVEQKPSVIIAFDDGKREPRLVAWNQLPVGQHCLYTHPKPKRDPLTVEQIAAATGAKPGTPTWLVAVAFTRAIEAAHNIK